MGLTWFHAVMIALVGPVVGYSWELNLGALFHDGTVLHTVGEGLCVAFFAALAGRKGITRKLQATGVGFGLMSSSAFLVHLSGGYIELHFHFFVMLAFLALYQDWVPYLLAIAYVAIHHGVVGVFWPEKVYNHTAAFNAPWTWAGIHAFFVLWASVGSIIAWRFNEVASARTRLILDSAGEGIYGLDLNGRATFVNPAAASMLGHEAEELIGKSMHDVLHHSGPDGNPYPKEECPIYAAFKDGVARRVTDEVFWRKDGTSFPVEYLSTPILERRQLRGAVVTFKDITERKRTETAREALYWASLQIQEPLGLQERLARLLQAAHDILHLDRLNILLAEREGRWLEGAATLGTKDPAEAMRIPIGPEGGGIAQAYLSQQPVIWSDSQAPVPGWIRLQPPYNRLEAFRSRAFAILPLVVQGRAIGVMGADRKHSRQSLEPELFPLLQLFAAQAALAIEHARLYEEQHPAAIHLEATVEARTQELHATNIRLEAASRHKSAFLANMSHELRTPLNSVLGFSELLQQQVHGPLTEKQARYLDNIHSSGQHLLALINDLLDLSKVEAGKIELRVQPFVLREALVAALSAIRCQADAKSLQLLLQVDEALSTLTADPLRFKQIVYNLLSNAVKFTPQGGQIIVTARQLHCSQFTVEGDGKPDRELSL
ncbi:MAG: PAS domain S-box protein, partial [candidate division NC10 bacterium]|nr:PAS domain S-box protein [candidate division NC10 bacterium]